MPASTRKVGGSKTNGRQQHESGATGGRNPNGLRQEATSFSRPAAAPPARSSSSNDTQAIAEAAYFLWLNRGGSDVENWLQAEAELRSSRGRH